ncbi:Site-specific recombinase XerD [Spirosomataceae bacterium TFI 002]|nr:Site-specific recombinase XerD [Spirosomataceae bacterium TFI 002]
MATASLYFDKRGNKGSLGTVKVMVTHERKQRLYTTKIQLEDSVWEKLNKNITKNGLSNRIKEEAYLELYEILYLDYDEFGEKKLGFIPRSNEIIESIGAIFSFDQFKHLFTNYGNLKHVSRSNDIYGFYERTIEKLLAEDRIGNANSYTCSMNSLKRFCERLGANKRLDFKLKKKYDKKEELPFEIVSVQFLKEYERWMLYEGKSSRKLNGEGSPASFTSIGIYLRHLRAIFNEAIGEGITNNYPFGKRKYIIPSGKSVKKAISKNDVLKIIAYNDFTNEYEKRSQNFWVFSYLSNGLNFTDILNLKWTDIDFERSTISLIREKTKRTNKQNRKEILIHLNEIQKKIIADWSTKESEFVFPFLQPQMSAIEQKATISQFIKVTNKWMRNIGEKLNIQSTLGTYVARHTFSTILLQNEAPIALISKSLGHSSLATTEAYLGSFEDEKVKTYMDKLV